MSYQQHSQNFKVVTRRNTWDARKRDELPEAVWEVDMMRGAGEVTAKFTLPATWGRILVFQYIDSLEQGNF